MIEFVSEYLRVQIDIERNPEGDSGEITRASTDAAASDLGWTASTTLEFGLIRQIADARKRSCRRCHWRKVARR